MLYKGLLDDSFTLRPEMELRFEVSEGKEKVTVELEEGAAEFFGSEMIIGKKYEFPGNAKVAIFTYHGCTIKVVGQTDIIYTSDETPMFTYFECHETLEDMRYLAMKKNRRGPVVMIVGSGNTGKSTVGRILLNYAVRMGRRPMFVDLDVDRGHIGAPGTIGAMVVTSPSDIYGFTQSPLVYHFGHTDPGANTFLYNHLVTNLANECSEYLEADHITNQSGIIINTSGWTKKNEFPFLLHAAQAFKVDVVLVLSHEGLHGQILKHKPESVKLISLPKSPGVLRREEKDLIEIREQRLRDYFFGSRIKINCDILKMKWSEVKIYKIGVPILPDSCLPLGMDISKHAIKLIAVTPGPNLLYRLLSVVPLTKSDINTPQAVVGFYCVEKVNVAEQTITFLTPHPTPLPNSILILSTVQYLDGCY